MFDINSKLQERAKLIADARAVLEKAQSENRDVTAQEEKGLEKLYAEADVIKAAVEREQHQQGLESNLREASRSPLKPDTGEQRAPAPGKPSEDRSWKGLFGETPNGSGFKSIDEFLTAVDVGRADIRLDALQRRAMSEGIPSEGGFAVPDQFGGWLMDGSLEAEIVRPRATVWPMTSDTRKVPGWNGFDHTSDTHGGIISYWINENTDITESEPKLRLLELNARKLACLTAVSNELVADGTDLATQLERALREATAFNLDYAFLNGDGAGKPLGVLNDPALIAVTKETGQVADTIVYQNLTSMFMRMHPGCRQRAVWIVNNDAIPQLLELSIAVGTGGSVVPVLSESGGAFKMLTRPVIFSEKVPALGDQGDIIFTDLSQYSIGLRKEITLDKSGHVGFAGDKAYYRIIVRVDGQGSWVSEVTPKKGTNSLSWAITLAERA